MTVGIVYFFINQDIPKGSEGLAAEELCQRIEKQIGIDRWKSIAALSFVFHGAEHFRDNLRDYREVSWKEGNDFYRVQYDKKGNYLAYRNEVLRTDEDSKHIYLEAKKRHTNDFFWLQPFLQLRAPGAKLYFVQERALLVHYESGGDTPGDTYLIITDAEAKPLRWQMWASILPIKGMEFSFEAWEKTKSGVSFSIEHSSSIFDIKITELETYSNYPERNKRDKFAKLIAKISL